MFNSFFLFKGRCLTFPCLFVVYGTCAGTHTNTQTRALVCPTRPTHTHTHIAHGNFDAPHRPNRAGHVMQDLLRGVMCSLW